MGAGVRLDREAVGRRRRRPQHLGASAQGVSEMNDSRPESLRRGLRELLRLLNAADVEATVIGGIAASLLGHPRVTNDVDALVLLPESDWKAFLDRAKKDGFPPRVR